MTGVGASIADGTVELADGWRLWRQAVLRGAGFPAAQVLALGAPEAAAAARHQLDLSTVEAEARARTLSVLQAATETAPPGGGKLLGKWIKRLRAGEPPDTTGAPPELVALLQPALAARAAVAEAQAGFERAFAAGRERVSAALRTVAADGRFREAVTWQSRGALRGSVDALLRQPISATDDKTRQQEQLVAGYLQRYCTKNDTIGFFGPIGWARVVPRGGAPEALPGPTLLSGRRVFFEYWAIDALAEKLAEDPELKILLPPRRLPGVRLDGRALHYPIDKVVTVGDEVTRVLSACDGRRNAREIAAALIADPALGLDGEDECYALLAELEEKKLLRWALEVPTHPTHPDRQLRRLLLALPDEPARQRALGALDELCAGRDAVERAAGDWQRVDESLRACEERFAQLTGQATVRSGMARNLLSEDCLRDLDLHLPDESLAGLGAPLGLLLHSARWLSWEVARRYREALQRVHATLAAETGSPVIDLLLFWTRTAELLSDNPRRISPLVDEVKSEIERRWASILRLDPTAHRVAFRADDLRAEVERAFDAPRPGWPSARFHSPDLMAVVDGGHVTFVLGELHCGDNTACMPLFVEHHAAPEQLHRLLRQAVGPRPEPVMLRQVVNRRANHSAWPDDLDVETGAARSDRPPERVLAVGDLVVDGSDGLCVRSRDRAHRFELLEFFGFNLTQNLGELRVLPPLPHLPRVTIDGLVIARERWRFEPAELAFARETKPQDRFLGAARFARALALPRFVFVKIPEEEKPLYVDLESPIYIEILAKLARKASAIFLSEMLPAVDQAWLPDAQGNRYVWELRTAAVDPEPWRAA